VVFIPECHEKVVRDGASLKNGDKQIGVRQHALRLAFNGLTCEDLSGQKGQSLIDQALQDQYGVRLPKMAGALNPPLWRTGGGSLVDDSGAVKAYCIVIVNYYEPVKPPDDKQVCAVPTEMRTGGDTPRPTRSDDGRTIPKNGETKINDGGRTVIVDGDQPREIQGPPLNDPYATSRGTWGQAYPDQWYLKAIRWLKDDGTTVLPDKGGSSSSR
jgi:hypothetical protein